MSDHEGKTKQRVWASSGLLSAILASSCCWGPILFSGFAGLSGSGSFFSWLHPFSPYLKGLAVLSLGVAFYQVYRKPAGSKEEEACCNEGSAIADGTDKKKQKRMLWAVTPLVLLALLFPYITFAFGGSGGGSGSPKTSEAITHAGIKGEQKETEKLVLEIEGMTCMGCQKRIHDALTEMEGVEQLKVSHEEGSGIVHYDPKKIQPEKIVKKIEELGYEAQEKEAG